MALLLAADCGWGLTVPARVEIDPQQVARVLTPVPGRITDVLVSVGDEVVKGQPLALIESLDADAAVAALLHAEAAVASAASALGKAEADLTRMRDLFDIQAIARKELRQAENDCAQSQAALLQARSAAQQAARRLEMWHLQPGVFGQKLVVRTPIAGKILERKVSAGVFWNDASAVLMTVADLRTVWVVADVAETQFRHIRLGARVAVRFAAYPGVVFAARMTYVGDVVDPVTRTVKIRAELGNPQGRLRPEMYGEVEVAGAGPL